MPWSGRIRTSTSCIVQQGRGHELRDNAKDESCGWGESSYRGRMKQLSELV